ncbi:MAG TPA: serine/threonine-protein kinase, partial [Pyrinomonadaceae bacterium]|nr:serine/threonine-protein kinase [Pyrinomonadaceae bacterium]
MKPERWRRISQLFKVALEKEPGERAAFLEESCPDDDEVRVAVASLIESHEQAEDEGFIESPLAGSYHHDPPAPAETQPHALPPGTTLGHYRVIEKIGEGGMGTVYLAKDTRLGRRVALKLLPAHMARDEELVRRFEQEARAASALNHPNIITVHDIGEGDGLRYIATEHIEGRTLRERLGEGRFTLDEALYVCEQIAAALAKAHGAGIIHRDIKPENIMVDEDALVKVLDFGIAKQVAEQPSPGAEVSPGGQVKTASGIVLGTSGYMSPEQVRGQPLDGRTDVWSLGCVLFEMLTGRTPFDAKNYGDLVVEILHADAPTVASLTGEAPEELEAVLRRALAKRREDRYGSAKEFRADLHRLRLMGLKLDNGTWTGGGTAAHRSTEIAPRPPEPQPTEQRKQVTV